MFFSSCGRKLKYTDKMEGFIDLKRKKKVEKVPDLPVQPTHPEHEQEISVKHTLAIHTLKSKKTFDGDGPTLMPQSSPIYHYENPLKKLNLSMDTEEDFDKLKLFRPSNTRPVENFVPGSVKYTTQEGLNQMLAVIGTLSGNHGCIVDEIMKSSFRHSEVLVPLHLKHENLTEFYGLIQREEDEEGTGRTVKIEMLLEYAGTALDHFLLDQSLSGSTIWSLTSQGLRALQQLDNLCISHLDVKPGNLCVRRTDKGLTLKLTDFGSAKLPQEAVEFCGWTPEYMSPESCKLVLQKLPPTLVKKSHISGKVDVFAFALVMMYMHTRYHILLKFITDGRTSYADYDIAQRHNLQFKLMNLHCTANLVQPLVPDECDLDMRELLMKMTQHDVERRLSAEQALSIVKDKSLWQLANNSDRQYDLLRRSAQSTTSDFKGTVAEIKQLQITGHMNYLNCRTEEVQTYVKDDINNFSSNIKNAQSLLDVNVLENLIRFKCEDGSIVWSGLSGLSEVQASISHEDVLPEQKKRIGMLEMTSTSTATAVNVQEPAEREIEEEMNADDECDEEEDDDSSIAADSPDNMKNKSEKNIDPQPCEHTTKDQLKRKLSKRKRSQSLSKERCKRIRPTVKQVTTTVVKNKSKIGGMKKAFRSPGKNRKTGRRRKSCGQVHPCPSKTDGQADKESTGDIKESGDMHYLEKKEQTTLMNKSKTAPSQTKYRSVKYKVVPGGTKRGRPLLEDSDGYKYTHGVKKNATQYWRCTVRKCPSAVTEVNGSFSFGRKEHIHQPLSHKPFETCHLKRASDKAIPTSAGLTESNSCTALGRKSKDTRSDIGLSSLKPLRRQRKKFVGRKILHLWTEDDGSTKWYSGSVTDTVKGKDGDPDTVYKVFYDEEKESYDLDLHKDREDGSLKFVDL